MTLRRSAGASLALSPTITAARRWRQDAYAALRAGTLTADRGQTLREAADDWLAAARAGIVRIFHNVRESYDRGREAARAAGADAARVPPRGPSATGFAKNRTVGQPPRPSCV